MHMMCCPGWLLFSEHGGLCLLPAYLFWDGLVTLLLLYDHHKAISSDHTVSEVLDIKGITWDASTGLTHGDTVRISSGGGGAFLLPKIRQILVLLTVTTSHDRDPSSSLSHQTWQILAVSLQTYSLIIRGKQKLGVCVGVYNSLDE
ncbi:hypothetical protein An12g07460 [Aspergillus niger]|uniref:Uncharacterized protein n=2 Tax=Aspergillus niger TaxID=5061 RepID=A2R056_ASPNC|nr:hypothetical protein An12g07460 [Aspergillus niger]CAK46370.1 hypothetical protein An12g07460 [Aspergillus niger]